MIPIHRPRTNRIKVAISNHKLILKIIIQGILSLRSRTIIKSHKPNSTVKETSSTKHKTIMLNSVKTDTTKTTATTISKKPNTPTMAEK